MPSVFASVSGVPSGPSHGTAFAGFSGLTRRVHSASHFPEPSIPPLLSAVAGLAFLLHLVWPSLAFNSPEPSSSVLIPPLGILTGVLQAEACRPINLYVEVPFPSTADCGRIRRQGP